MNNLNEAVIKLINEDVVGGQKLIEQELYSRLGLLLEEKLKDFAPSVFSHNQKVVSESSEDLSETNLDEDQYEALLEQLQEIIDEIEAETGETLNETQVEEIAEMLLEESDPGDEDEGEEEDDDIEEDSDEEE